MDRVACRVCGVIAVVVVVLTGWLVGASGAEASGWLMQPFATPPRQPPTWMFTRVSCASPSDCIALGEPVGAAVEHWNGAKWSIDRWLHALEGVSCAPGRGCVSVGGDAPQASSVRWSIPAGIAGYGVSSLSCASPTACTAIGRAATVGTRRPEVIEHWNGKNWAIQPIEFRFNDQFDAVSCPSASDCILVGSYDEHQCVQSGDGGHCDPGALALTERWNGTKWSPQRSRTPPWGVTDMSCASPVACVAIGQLSSPRAFVERWNGKTWSMQQIPHAGVGIVLYGVSCASATTCTVVGGYNGGAGGGPVAERWNGERWSIQRIPSLASRYGGLLADVSCPTPTDCTAVGFGFPTAGSQTGMLLAERWTGRG